MTDRYPRDGIVVTSDTGKNRFYVCVEGISQVSKAKAGPEGEMSGYVLKPALFCSGAIT